jgi:hypothetical protein
MAIPHTDASKIKMTYGSYRFWPAPFMAFGMEPQKTDAGERLADKITLSFAGTLLNTDNIPSGDTATMITLRDSLVNALSGDNREFQLLHHIGSTQPSGTVIISGIYPRVESLSFDESNWVNKIDYSFTLSYETHLVSGAVPVESYGEDWDFEEDSSNRVIRIKHDVNAKGVNTTISGGTSNALENARTWVNARMGTAGIPSGLPQFCDSGTLGTFVEQKYRSEAASVTDGTYSASEQITQASGSYAHNYTAQFQQDDAGITTLSINGNIEGLGRFDTASDAATSGWNVFVSPTLSGLAASIYTELSGTRTLNVSNVQSLSVTKDVYGGRVGYSVSYNDNPEDALPSGIAEFSVSKQIKLPIRKKAIFAIPSRIAGSIVQDIGTPTDGSIVINGTCKGTIDTQLAYVKSYCSDQINELRPNAASYNQIWFGDYNKTENEDQKTFSFNLAWAYTDNLTNVPDPSGEVSF